MKRSAAERNSLLWQPMHGTIDVDYAVVQRKIGRGVASMAVSIFSEKCKGMS